VGWTLLDDAHPDWTTFEFVATATQAGLNDVPSLADWELMIQVRPEKPSLHWFDIDGIEVIDDATGEQLISTDVGGFAASSQKLNRPGDFAANVIDRLGGVAAWGSSSHFLTGGWAYRRMDVAMPMLFSGRTLGESLLGAGNLWSGLFFGDPLYRPLALSLRSEDGTRDVHATLDQGTVSDPPRLRITAMNGTARRDLAWTLEMCAGPDVATCSVMGDWEVAIRGRGPVDDVPVDWTPFVELTGEAQSVFVRLRADGPDGPLFANSTIWIEPQKP
jgi:hypothetical protein